MPGASLDVHVPRKGPRQRASGRRLFWVFFFFRSFRSRRLVPVNAVSDGCVAVGPCAPLRKWSSLARFSCCCTLVTRHSMRRPEAMALQECCTSYRPQTALSFRQLGPCLLEARLQWASGLAFHPQTRVLYGATSTGSPTFNKQLVTINPSTAAVTVVGAFGVGPTMSDITFCPDGTLYGVSSAGTHWLYSINLATGAATKVGTGSDSFSFGGGGLACDAATIYNMEGTELFAFDTSGNRALISSSLPPSMNSADFWQGTLYA
jgi:hypothetical protein